MKIALVGDWKAVLKKAWSVRLMVLGALFTGLEVILPLFVDNFHRGWFGALSFLTTIGAFVARIMPQKGLTYDTHD